MHLRSLLWILAVVAVGCSPTLGDQGASPVAPDAPGATVEQATRTAHEDVPSALSDMTADGLPAPLIDPADVMSGGPPPDGIPPIEEPRFLTPDEVDFLADNEPVLALDIEGDARAYPVQVMIWHEIVNDTVGDVPVSVTYCPLCNSAIAFDGRLGDRVLDFGTSGSLYQSALVMYDRQTESLWSHFSGEAFAGHLTGEELATIPLTTVSWGDWRTAHPEGLVLSRDTGFDRDYGRNPYPGYDDVNDPPFLFDGESDDRLEAKRRVVGVGRDTEPTAVVLDDLLDAGVLEFDLDGRGVAAWSLPGTASALEGSGVADGRDVGTTGVFVAAHDGDTLTFTRVGAGFEDRETGTRWDVFGRAVSGPLAGAQLEQITHVDTFWFAWAAFSPDSRIIP